MGECQISRVRVSSEWSVNRITEPQPTIFDVTETDYFKSGRQPHQTATDYDNRQLTDGYLNPPKMQKISYFPSKSWKKTHKKCIPKNIFLKKRWKFFFFTEILFFYFIFKTKKNQAKKIVE